MDWSQIKTLIEGFGPVQWVIVAAIVGLFLGADKKVLPLAKGIAGYARSLFQRGILDDKPAPEGATIPLIKQMEMLEARREYLLSQRAVLDLELDQIDAKLGVKRD